MELVTVNMSELQSSWETQKHRCRASGHASSSSSSSSSACSPSLAFSLLSTIDAAISTLTPPSPDIFDSMSQVRQIAAAGLHVANDADDGVSEPTQEGLWDTRRKCNGSIDLLLWAAGDTISSFNSSADMMK